MVGEVSVDDMLDQRSLCELDQHRTSTAGATRHLPGFLTLAPADRARVAMADDLGIEPRWRKV